MTTLLTAFAGIDNEKRKEVRTASAWQADFFLATESPSLRFDDAGRKDLSNECSGQRSSRKLEPQAAQCRLRGSLISIQILTACRFCKPSAPFSALPPSSNCAHLQLYTSDNCWSLDRKHGGSAHLRHSKKVCSWFATAILTKLTDSRRSQEPAANALPARGRHTCQA